MLLIRWVTETGTYAITVVSLTFVYCKPETYHWSRNQRVILAISHTNSNSKLSETATLISLIKIAQQETPHFSTQIQQVHTEHV